MAASEALTEYLEQRGLSLDTAYLREALRTLAQVLMEAQVSQIVEAAPYERVDSRRAYRNGYRASLWTTPVGDISLQIPKLRKGSYYPTFLGSEQVLLRLVREAYVLHEIGFAQLQEALDKLAMPALDAHNLADIAERLNDTVYNALRRVLTTDYPYLMLDVIELGRGQQLLLALGIQASGEIGLLGHELARHMDDACWRALLRHLRARGLDALDTVISRDYPGVRTAIKSTYADAVWQHHQNFMLNREADEILVDAVSRLVVGMQSDNGQSPQMLFSRAQFEDETSWSIFAVA